MSVDQTSQLLQLILNSVLMMAVCGLILMGLLAHQGVIYQRLQWVNREYRDQLVGTARLQRDRFSALKTHQLTLRQHYRQIQRSIFLTYGGLWLLAFSTLCLALRTLWNVGGLIPISLGFFMGGNGLLLLGFGVALLEVRRSQGSVLAELRDWVGWGSVESMAGSPETSDKMATQRGRSRSQPQLLPAKRINAG